LKNWGILKREWTNFRRCLIPPSPLVLLDFLFMTLARRIPSIRLGEGAAEARYLENLSGQAEPKDQRKLLRKLSLSIWGAVLQRAKFKAADKEKVIEFLPALMLRRSSKQSGHPHHRRSFVHLPTLRGPSMTVTLGKGTPRLVNDLSERIYAGYWALRFTGIGGAHQHVADPLNRHHIPCRSQAGTRNPRTGYEVAERLKAYEKRGLTKPGGDRNAGRRWLVEKWNVFYYPNPAWGKTSSGEQS
jgi:hypothetical protein